MLSGAARREVGVLLWLLCFERLFLWQAVVAAASELSGSNNEDTLRHAGSVGQTPETTAKPAGGRGTVGEAAADEPSGRDANDESEEGGKGGDDEEEEKEDPMDPIDRVARLYLPKAVSFGGAQAVAALMVFKTMHESTAACFESLPGMSAMTLTLFVASFCWVVLSTFWFMDTEVIMQLDKLTAFGGLYATMELILTPTLLFMPNQTHAAELVQGIVGTELHQRVHDAFDKWKGVATSVYLLLFACQVCCSVFVYRIASAQNEAIKSNMAFTGGLEDQDENGAAMLTLLYLLLSYCNFCIVYERLFGSALAADFPNVLLDRVFCGSCSGVDRRIHNAVGDFRDRAGEFMPLTEMFQGSGIHADFAAAGDEITRAVGEDRASFAGRAQMITASVDAFVKSVHEKPGAQTVHWFVYCLYGGCSIVFTVCLTVRVLQSPWSLASLLRLPFGLAMAAFVAFFMYFIFGTLCGFMLPSQQPMRIQCDEAANSRVAVQYADCGIASVDPSPPSVGPMVTPMSVPAVPSGAEAYGATYGGAYGGTYGGAGATITDDVILGEVKGLRDRLDYLDCHWEKHLLKLQHDTDHRLDIWKGHLQELRRCYHEVEEQIEMLGRQLEELKVRMAPLESIQGHSTGVGSSAVQPSALRGPAQCRAKGPADSLK